MTFSNIYIFIGTVALILYPDTALSISNDGIWNFDVQTQIGKKDDEIYLPDIVMEFARNRTVYFNVTLSQITNRKYFNLYLMKHDDVLKFFIKDEIVKRQKIPIARLCKCTDPCQEFTVTIKLNNDKESKMSCNNGESEYLAKSKIQPIWITFKFRSKNNRDANFRSQFLKVYFKKNNVLYYFSNWNKQNMVMDDGFLLTLNNRYGYLNFSLSNECVLVSIPKINKKKVLYGSYDSKGCQWRSKWPNEDKPVQYSDSYIALVVIVIVLSFIIILIGIIYIVIQNKKIKKLFAKKNKKDQSTTDENSNDKKNQGDSQRKKDEKNQGESQGSPPDNNADTTDGKKKDEKNQGESEKLLSDNNAGTSDGKKNEDMGQLQKNSEERFDILKMNNESMDQLQKNFEEKFVTLIKNDDGFRRDVNQLNEKFYILIKKNDVMRTSMNGFDEKYDKLMQNNKDICKNMNQLKQMFEEKFGNRFHISNRNTYLIRSKTDPIMNSTYESSKNILQN